MVFHSKKTSPQYRRMLEEKGEVAAGEFHKPMFSKRHYEAIAGILTENILRNNDIHNVVDTFVKMFSEDNKNFDIDKFKNAVYLGA
jgi:hypothetical protein